jgi:hypothetical protein
MPVRIICKEATMRTRLGSIRKPAARKSAKVVRVVAELPWARVTAVSRATPPTKTSSRA